MLDQAALEGRVANLEKMIEVSRTLRSAFDLQSLLQGIIRAIVELVQCERSSILLIEPETGELRFVAASGTDFDQIKDIAVCPDRRLLALHTFGVSAYDGQSWREY